MKTVTLEFLSSALKQPNLIKQDKAWLTHIKPFLAAIKPKSCSTDALGNRYSITEYFVSLGTRDPDEVVFLEDSRKATIAQIILIWRILGGTTRSDILPSSMSQMSFPEYSAAVPIGMLAFKERFGINYNQWLVKNDHPKFQVMKSMLFGKSLSNICEITEYLRAQHPNAIEQVESTIDLTIEDRICGYSGYDCFDPEQQKTWREEVTRNGFVSSSEYAKLAKIFVNDEPLGYTYVPKFYWLMLTQTWIFDPKVRHPTMITNLLDWDIPAVPLESLSVIKDGLPF